VLRGVVSILRQIKVDEVPPVGLRPIVPHIVRPAPDQTQGATRPQQALDLRSPARYH